MNLNVAALMTEFKKMDIGNDIVIDAINKIVSKKNNKHLVESFQTIPFYTPFTMECTNQVNVSAPNKPNNDKPFNKCKECDLFGNIHADGCKKCESCCSCNGNKGDDAAFLLDVLNEMKQNGLMANDAETKNALANIKPNNLSTKLMEIIQLMLLKQANRNLPQPQINSSTNIEIEINSLIKECMMEDNLLLIEQCMVKVFLEIEKIIKNNPQLNVLNLKEENMAELFKYRFTMRSLSILKIMNRPFTINLRNITSGETITIERDVNGNSTHTFPNITNEGPLRTKILEQASEIEKLKKAAQP